MIFVLFVCRAVPLGIPTITMNANGERRETENSNPSILLDGEKYSLLSTRDPILNPGPLGSPLRRDRHASPLSFLL